MTYSNSCATRSINTTDIFPLYDPTEVPQEYYVYVTVTDEDLLEAIQTAHDLGLRIMLKPHVDPLTDNSPIGNTWFVTCHLFLTFVRGPSSHACPCGCPLNFQAWGHRQVLQRLSMGRMVRKL